MSLKNIQQTMPDYAKDVKLNLSGILNSEGPLTKQQLWGTILATSIASKNSALIKAANEDAKANLSPEAVSAAKIAATIMGMNNIYYRFTHSVADTAYSTMPANLRMTMMAQSGIDKNDFELFSLAVSAVNGCGYCMDAHEKSLIKNGFSKEVIQVAARIAAIIYSTATVLNIENA